jgi:hypothetical protein
MEKPIFRCMSQDWNMVQNSLKESFSNGPVEGHINRLKTLKRPIYVAPVWNCSALVCSLLLFHSRCALHQT